MAEIPDVGPGELITAAYNNDIRDRAIMRYANEAARDASVLVPVDGDAAYLTNLNKLTIYNGANWESWARNPDSSPLEAASLSVPADGSQAAVMNSNGTIYGVGMIVAHRIFFDGVARPDGFALTTLTLPTIPSSTGRILVQGIAGGQDAGLVGFNVTGQGVSGNIGDRVEVTSNRFQAVLRWADLSTFGAQTITVESNSDGIHFYRGYITVLQLT